MKFNQQFTVLINFIEKSRNFRNFKLFLFLQMFFWNIFSTADDVMMKWRHDWNDESYVHCIQVIGSSEFLSTFVHRVCSELTRRPRIWSYNKWYLIGWWDDALIGWWYSIMRGRISKAKSVPNYIGCFDSEFILHKEKTLKGLL